MIPIDWDAMTRIVEASPNVIGAWVFGSAQKGYVREGGDLDIGVLFASPPSLDERATLSADLQETLHVDAIDMLVLNEAGPHARFEAVSGSMLYCRDRDRCAEFVSITAREYEDEMALVRKSLR